VVSDLVEVYKAMAFKNEVKIITKTEQEERALKVTLEPQSIKDQRIKVSKLDPTQFGMQSGSHFIFKFKETKIEGRKLGDLKEIIDKQSFLYFWLSVKLTI
jgi:hypothetical protein